MHYLTQNGSESQSGRPATLPCRVHLPKFHGVSVLGGQPVVSYRAHLAWFGGISLRGGTMHALPDTEWQRKSVR